MTNDSGRATAEVPSGETSGDGDGDGPGLEAFDEPGAGVLPPSTPWADELGDGAPPGDAVGSDSSSLAEPGLGAGGASPMTTPVSGDAERCPDAPSSGELDVAGPVDGEEPAGTEPSGADPAGEEPAGEGAGSKTRSEPAGRLPTIRSPSHDEKTESWSDVTGLAARSPECQT